MGETASLYQGNLGGKKLCQQLNIPRTWETVYLSHLYNLGVWGGTPLHPLHLEKFDLNGFIFILLFFSVSSVRRKKDLCVAVDVGIGRWV